MKKSGSKRLSASLIAAIKEAGFDSPEDILLVTPIRYQAPVPPINLVETRKDVKPGLIKVVSRAISYPEQISTFPPLIHLAIQAKDSQLIVVFNGLLDAQANLLKIKPDDELTVSGVLSSDWSYLFNAQLVEKEPLVALYKGKTKGFSKTLPAYINYAFLNLIRKAEVGIQTIFSDIDKVDLFEFINLNLGDKKFSSIKQLLFSLHFPFTEDEATFAKKAVSNLASLDCCIRAKKASARPKLDDSVIEINPSLMSDLISKLPFNVTIEQKKAMADVWRDLAQPYPMNRLLSGDVGTGKSCVIGVIAVASHLQRKKVAIFTPNGILTDQLYTEIKSWFPDVPIEKVTKDEKPSDSYLDQNAIFIGTHAIINWSKSNNYCPDLLIVDEQQKSSRDQRESMLRPHTNLLEATATCLPRTFALMLYGGMKISTIKKQPVTKNLSTKIVYDSDKTEVFSHIKQTIRSGGKVAVILPLVVKNVVNGESEIDVEKDKLAVESAMPLWETAFPGQVICLHGKMTEVEKLRRIQSIKDDNSKSILIATTLIEIGMTIKDLRHLIVIEPDRYGISTLHQMRGRLARNGGDGMMHLLLKKPPEEIKDKTLSRLKALEVTTCGFELSEIDATNRGWGDLAEDSELQSGDIVTLFKNVVIPNETISSIQSKFEDNESRTS